MMQLTEAQLDWLCERIPDPPRNPLGGRPPADKRQVMCGIFWTLDDDAKWKDLPSRFGPKCTVHLCFQRWVQDGVFKRIMRDASRLVGERGEHKLYECFIYGTFSKVRGGGDGIGSAGVGKGVKITVVVDARGLPVAVDTMSAAPHEPSLVQGLFDFMLTEETPERIVGEKAYDSDPLDDSLADSGVGMIAPHRKNRKAEHKTQDGRRLRRHKRRWAVERTIGWIQNYRRLCIRWEKSTTLFQGYLHLSCALVLVKQIFG